LHSVVTVLISVVASTVMVLASAQSKKLSTSIRMKGLDMNDKLIIVWNGKKAELRETKEGSIGVSGSFATKAKTMQLHGEDVYQAVGNKIEVCFFVCSSSKFCSPMPQLLLTDEQVCNLQGVVKRVLTFSEIEGTSRQPFRCSVAADNCFTAQALRCCWISALTTLHA
jgi:hypothetical protein